MSAETGAGGSTTFCPPERRVFVLVAAVLASAMGFIDGSVVSIATPAIRADIGATFTDAQWIANGYMLLLASLTLIGGAAGDRFGVRRTFATGIAVFVAASMAAAFAPSPAVLILARAVQGAGAALMVPGSLALIAKAYPRTSRGRAIGIWATASSLTTVLGPVVGGATLTALGDWSWRLVFGINLVLGGVALVLLLARVPRDAPGKGRRLDLVGGGLATFGLFGISLGLTGTGEDDVPMLSHIVLWCGLGLLGMVLFLLWERRAKAPMMPLRLFANVPFSGANALTLCLYFALSGVTFFLPMTLIGGWDVSEAEVALAFLPLGAAITVLSTFSGSLADRFGPAPPIAGGAALVAIALAGLALNMGSQNLWLGVAPWMGLLGIGMGFVVSPLSTAVMTALEDEDSGIASGVNNAVARVAGLLAIAICGGLIALVFPRALGPFAELNIFFGVRPSGTLAADAEAARIAATNAAFSAVAWFTAGLALVSAAIAWVTQEKRFGRAPPEAGGRR